MKFIFLVMLLLCVSCTSNDNLEHWFSTLKSLDYKETDGLHGKIDDEFFYIKKLNNVELGIYLYRSKNKEEVDFVIAEISSEKNVDSNTLNQCLQVLIDDLDKVNKGLKKNFLEMISKKRKEEINGRVDLVSYEKFGNATLEYREIQTIKPGQFKFALQIDYINEHDLGSKF